MLLGLTVMFHSVCQPPIPPEQFNAAEYTKEVVFGGVATESIAPPAAYEFEEFQFKVDGQQRYIHMIFDDPSSAVCVNTSR